MAKSESKLDTIIGKESKVKGTLTIKGSVRIDGEQEGNVTISDSLYCGKNSKIKGNIKCKNAVIGGKVEGNIDASETVEIESGAYVKGDILCKELIIHPQVFFEGHSKMNHQK